MLFLQKSNFYINKNEINPNYLILNFIDEINLLKENKKKIKKTKCQIHDRKQEFIC